MIEAVSDYALLSPIILTLAGFLSAVGLVLSPRVKYSYSLTVYAVAKLSVALLVAEGFVETAIEDGDPLVYMLGGWPPPLGVTYIADSLSLTIAIVVAAVSTISVIAFWLTRAPVNSKILFQVFSLILEASLLGALFTADFFHLFVMWEVASVASVGVSLAGGLDQRVVRAAFTYLLASTLASTIYMFMVALAVYGAFGTLSIPDYVVKSLGSEGIAGVSGGVYGNQELAAGFLLAGAIAAFGLSAGLFPLHFWMPSLYERLSPPAAMILAGAKEVVAVYIVVRMVYTIHSNLPHSAHVVETVQAALLALGVAGAVYGAFSMLASRSFGRMMAYYLVMDAGIIFAALSAGGARALEAFIYLAVSHSAVVIGLFSLSGLPDSPDTGQPRYKRVVGSLLGAGVPPFSGFFGKLLAIYALVDEPLALALFITAALASSVAPLVGILGGAYKSLGSSTETARVYTALLVLGALASLILGVGFPVLKESLLEPTAASAASVFDYIERALREAAEIYEKYWPRS